MARAGQTGQIQRDEMRQSTHSTLNRRNGFPQFLLCLLVFFFFFSTLVAVETEAGTVNPNKIVCKNRDMKPAIPIEKCKPSFDTKRNACEKLIRECKCQHGIEMKWTGAGCPGSKGDGVSVILITYFLCPVTNKSCAWALTTISRDANVQIIVDGIVLESVAVTL